MNKDDTTKTEYRCRDRFVGDVLISLIIQMLILKDR